MADEPLSLRSQRMMDAVNGTLATFNHSNMTATEGLGAAISILMVTIAKVGQVLAADPQGNADSILTIQLILGHVSRTVARVAELPPEDWPRFTKEEALRHKRGEH